MEARLSYPIAVCREGLLGLVRPNELELLRRSIGHCDSIGWFSHCPKPSLHDHQGERIPRPVDKGMHQSPECKLMSRTTSQ
uniref:Uncharacterized protein n=1 Tax=Musa acuminata subsp. malaccensis TaxID=214687 RepID=A0A804I5Y8_MUSAM